MITLCIRYTLDISKLADFEDYARRFPEPIERCGGKLVGYYMPTKIAGPTNFALALIDFPGLAAYEIYRANLLADADAVENVRRMEKSGCVLIEDRSILRQVPKNSPAVAGAICQIHNNRSTIAIRGCRMLVKMGEGQQERV